MYVFSHLRCPISRTLVILPSTRPPSLPTANSVTHLADPSPAATFLRRKREQYGHLLDKDIYDEAWYVAACSFRAHAFLPPLKWRLLCFPHPTC